MRRQARISAGGALVVRTASALQVWLWLLIFVFQNEFRISRSIQPGYLDFDNLPETNFTCAGKVIGGYYADLETSCQMFHVCTVGQQDEPMDIKFLCLNGTVFDQETRVCERVDEVDCTKSEKFYSLNLELYGSTAPPIIQPEQIKPQTQPTQQSHQQTKTSDEETDPNINDSSTSSVDKTSSHVTEIIDSTDDPVDTKKQDPHHQESVPTHSTATGIEDIIDDNQEAEDVDENADYEEDYTHLPTTTTTQAPVPTTKSSTKTPPTTTTVPQDSSPHQPSQIPHFISTSSPALSSLSPPIHSSSISSSPSAPTLDPSLLSPQEFIYRHRGPGSEAISFQRQSLRPADGVFITHAPPQQFDHFQYESSRTQPRPSAPRPAPFVQRPQPFRPTTLDPRNQLLRPAPTLLPAEKQENPQNNKHPFPPSLASRPLPFDPYYYDRKRSDDSVRENESSLAARSVAPPTVTERPPTKLKSPPRVIVTASASVSDSNGKRLNYTVGNVVSAVKPIVPINYDDYKESDLIFDPFFLDVPKLQKRRKTRSSRNRRVFTVPATATVSLDIVKEKTTVSSPVTSRATTTERSSTTAATTTTTAAWNPNDYVDDNYEPHAYVPPVPPLAVLVPHKFSKEERHHKSRVAQTTSSQSVGSDTSPVATSQPPSPRPLEAPACATSRSTDCRTRA